MNYFIIRDGQEYGPYTLADLQRYVAAGQILLTDMARSEGMSDPQPVSQIVGTIPVPVAAPYQPAAPAMPYYPDPPNLHWGLVLLFGIITCGMFSIVWALILASWMKKVAPQSRAIYWYIAEAVMLLPITFTGFSAGLHHTGNPSGSVLNLINFRGYIWNLSNRRKQLADTRPGGFNDFLIRFSVALGSRLDI